MPAETVAKLHARSRLSLGLPLALGAKGVLFAVVQTGRAVANDNTSYSKSCS